MSPMALAWEQFRFERKLFWRNPSAAFFNFVLPLLFLALFGAVFAGDQDNLDVLVPGIAGMSIVSTTFVALAYQLVFLREEGVLKRLRGTPMPAGAYLAALAAHAVTNAAIQLGVGGVYRVAWRDESGEMVARESEDPTGLLHQLTSAALARGEALRDISVTRPSLEDVYLDLTAEAEQPAPASGDGARG